MLSDIDNARKLAELLGDDGFVDALQNVETLVEDVGETLERVEQVETEADEAVREANEALNAVDYRLSRFDETIRLIEAKVEAGFSIGFFFFALQQWTTGSTLLAVGLFLMGLLGVSSLAVTVATMPQVRRLRQLGGYLTDRLDETDEETNVAIDTRDPDEHPADLRVDWRTTDDTSSNGMDSPDEENPERPD